MLLLETRAILDTIGSARMRSVWTRWRKGEGGGCYSHLRFLRINIRFLFLSKRVVCANVDVKQETTKIASLQVFVATNWKSAVLFWSPLDSQFCSIFGFPFDSHSFPLPFAFERPLESKRRNGVEKIQSEAST